MANRNMDGAKQAVLDKAVSDILKRYGDGSIMRLGEQKALDIEALSTGSLSLDVALGIGGLPRGRVVEIYGPESSGKTTLVYHVIAEAQRRGGICAFIDAEHAMDPKYAKMLGVNTDDLLVSQPDSGEQALEHAEVAFEPFVLPCPSLGFFASLLLASCATAATPTTGDVYTSANLPTDYENAMPVRNQLVHAGRRQTDPVFVVLDLLGYGDAHGRAPVAWEWAALSKSTSTP